MGTVQKFTKPVRKAAQETKINVKAVVATGKIAAPLVKKPANPGHGGPRKRGRPVEPLNQANKKLATDILTGAKVIKEAGDELPETATPLEVMMMAMRSAYKLGGALAAFPYAEKAAPYIHARVAQMQLIPPKDPDGNTTKGGTIMFGWIGEAPKTQMDGAVDVASRLLD